MPSSSTLTLATLLILATLQTVSAHFSIVYPAWRGNTLHDDLQWNYPCQFSSPPLLHLPIH